MDYINTPNLPEKKVEVALVDGRIGCEAEETLIKLGIRLLKTRKHKRVYDAISFHPDIMFHHIGGNIIIYAPGVDGALLQELSSLGFELVEGSSQLTTNYPGDISYNAARVGKYVFHNFNCTDIILEKMLEKKNLELVNIKQGYSKCSISVVDENSIITSDPGIARAANSKGIEVLLIAQDESIALFGMDKGFIGGCSGLIAKNIWAINGRLELLKSCNDICGFLGDRNIKPISLSNGVITDIGTIIPLITE